MPTNTFDHEIVIRNPESVEKLFAVISSDTPRRPLSETPFTAAEKQEGERLLKQCVLRSRCQKDV